MKLWKAVFILNVVLLILEIAQLFYVGFLGLFEFACLLLHVFTLLSIWGSINGIAIGTQWFAKRVWFLNAGALLISVCVLVFVFYAARPVDNNVLLFVLTIVIFSLVSIIPVFKYAYRSENVWAKNA